MVELTREEAARIMWGWYTDNEPTEEDIADLLAYTDRKKAELLAKKRNQVDE